MKYALAYEIAYAMKYAFAYEIYFTFCKAENFTITKVIISHLSADKYFTKHSRNRIYGCDFYFACVAVGTHAIIMFFSGNLYQYNHYN